MWLPFSKKQKKTAPPLNFSFLNADMHAHFLPGLDDGAPDLETSLILIDHLRQLGYRKLIASPHISMEFYPNTPEKINAALKLVQEAVEEKCWDIQLEAAAEYMIDDRFLQMLGEANPLLSFGGNKVLIEMGYVYEHPMLKEAIFQLQAQGYQPVLAHPERYHFYHHHPEKIERLLETGCQLQLNILALTTHYGEPAKKLAEMLLNKSYYTLAGTDLHHSRHAHLLASLSQAQYQLLQSRSYVNVNL